jgi:hypothetical protein
MSISTDVLLYETGKIIFTAIIATGASLLAQRFFIERSQKRSQHSKEFAKDSLNVLTQRIQDICQEGCVYDFKLEKLVPMPLQPYTSLPYSDYLKEHFVSGYTDELKLWENIELKTREYNAMYAELGEKIRRDLFKEYPSLTEKEYYYQVGHNEPQVYVRPDYIVVTIIEELLNRLKGYKEWFNGGVDFNSFESSGRKFYCIRSDRGGNLVQSIQPKNSEIVQIFIMKKVTDAELIKDVGVLQTLKRDKDMYLAQLSNKAVIMKSSIELGNTIKGRCEVCKYF